MEVIDLGLEEQPRITLRTIQGSVGFPDKCLNTWNHGQVLGKFCEGYAQQGLKGYMRLCGEGGIERGLEGWPGLK